MINKRNKNKLFAYFIVASLPLLFIGCGVPAIVQKEAKKDVPANYSADLQDSLNTVQQLHWKQFFTDDHLVDLINTGLENNQELNIILQEIAISQNEVKTRKGEYLPFVDLGAGAGIEKAAAYTRDGAVEEHLPIREGEEFPDPLPDFVIGAHAHWEVDIWNKLHNAKKAAVMRYLSSVEGKNFMVTNLIAEIANSYYELLALDNQLAILNQNIELQSNALRIVKIQKQAARVTELAVQKFEAEVLHTKSLQYDIQQKIVETENKINFLIGRYPQHVEREVVNFTDLVPADINAGIPSQLLENRTDVQQAELELEAAKLDIKVAKARFYPSLGISASVGYQAFNPKYLVNTPESLLYSVAGDLMAPLINRNAIKAAYSSASAKQIQAVYHYEQTLLNAYIEVANQLAKKDNLAKSYALKADEVAALNRSIQISNNLFQSARADYMEVLLTQRDALESKFELIETKMQQMNTMVNLYRALGGGWQ